MKRCRYCAEEIHDEAILCKHCGQPAVSREIEALARRWGAIGQSQRDAEWAALSDSDKAQLEVVLGRLRGGRRTSTRTKVVLVVVLGLVLLAVGCELVNIGYEFSRLAR